MIRSEIDKICHGKSCFQLPDINSKTINTPLQQASGSYILWPLANTYKDIRLLLHALNTGIVPILIPAAMPQGKITKLLQRFPCVGYLDRDRIIPPHTPCDVPRKIFLALLTSGSTGEPKIIATGEENLEAGIAAIHHAQDLDPVKTTGVTLPLAYSYALVNQLFWAIVYGRELFLPQNTFSPQELFTSLASNKVEMVCFVAEQFRTLVAKGTPSPPLQNILRVNFAGAPFPAELFGEIRALFPNARIFNNYGCTEAMPRLTTLDVSEGIVDSRVVGSPIETITIQIPGNQKYGPLEFNGPSSSIGTINRAGRLIPHPQWIRSGDDGYIENGKVSVYGRNDLVISIGGERHSLLEIEHALTSLAITHSMAWLGVMDGRKTAIHLVVSGTAQVNRSTLRNCFQNFLPRPLWPRRVFWTNRWPTTPNGKTDRKKLQQWVQDGKLTEL